MRGQKETWCEYEILTLLSSCIKPISVQNSSKEMKCKIVKFWNFLTTAMMMIIIPFHGRAQVAHSANTLRYERNNKNHRRNHFWRKIAFFPSSNKIYCINRDLYIKFAFKSCGDEAIAWWGPNARYNAWTDPAEIVCASVETRQPLGKLNRKYSNC